jgi:hypothetical protein
MLRPGDRDAKNTAAAEGRRMTPEEFTRIVEWDAKCGTNELVMFGTTIDRRRLIEYVKELQLQIKDLRP